MNQAMQSFLLKTVYCILIINITFCSSCFRSVCKARCYFRHKGFDFGYCEDGICKCAPPVVYVFDGIGRDLSDEYIHNSLVNNNIIQNSIPILRTSASDASDENKRNKLQQQKENDAENVNSKNSPIVNGASNRLPLQGTTLSTQASPQISKTAPKTVNKLTAFSPRNIVPNKNGVTNTLPENGIADSNLNEQQNSHPNSNKLQPKQTPNQEDDKNDEIVLELSEETYEDSNEQSVENIKEESSVKPETPNDKAGNNLPVPVNEKLDVDSSYESGSRSYEYYEEDDDNKVVDAVPASNK